MRAREPDEAGVVERDGVRIAWESFGTCSFQKRDGMIDQVGSIRTVGVWSSPNTS